MELFTLSERNLRVQCAAAGSAQWEPFFNVKLQLRSLIVSLVLVGAAAIQTERYGKPLHLSFQEACTAALGASGRSLRLNQSASMLLSTYVLLQPQRLDSI